MAWVVIGETFPLRTRAKQASLATAANWLGNCELLGDRSKTRAELLGMISFLTPLANDGISYAFGFVFVGTNLAAAALVWFFLFETRMLSLENVDKMYSQPGLKAWHSSKWIPEGYVTRELKAEKGLQGSRFSNDTLRVDGEAGQGGAKGGAVGTAENKPQDGRVENV